MRALAVSVVMAAVLAGAAAAGPMTVTWPANGPLHLLYVGDSLTDGALSVYYRNQFRYVVLDALSKHGQVTMTTLGKGGVTVDYWAGRRMPAGQNLAVVELGTNNAREIPVPNASYLAAFNASYRKLVAKIQAKSPGVKLVCLGVWHPVGEPGSPAVYDTQIRRDCPGAFVSIANIGATRSHLGSDEFHPNDVGHELIGARIVAAIAVH